MSATNQMDLVLAALNAPRPMVLGLDMPDEDDVLVVGDMAYQYGVIEDFEVDGVPYERFGWELLCPRCDLKALYPEFAGYGSPRELLGR